MLGELHPRIAEQYDIASQTVCFFEIDLEKLLETRFGESYTYELQKDNGKVDTENSQRTLSREQSLKYERL